MPPSDRATGTADSADGTTRVELDARSVDLIDRRERALGPAYRLSYARPLEVAYGSGMKLFDTAGREYLDAYNNVASVGHCNPEVVAAIREQAGRLNTNTRYLDAALVDYAERLLDTHADELEHVMFTCSGSEAVDLAVRISRYVTGGSGVIVTDNAYHGVTTAASEISPSLGLRTPLTVRTVPAPSYDGDVGVRFARDVGRALDDLEQAGVRFAALVVDTVFASEGLYPDPAAFLRPVRDLVERKGGPLHRR